MNDKSLWSGTLVDQDQIHTEEHPAFFERHRNWLTILAENPAYFWAYFGLVSHYRMKREPHYRLLLRGSLMANAYRDMHHYLSRAVSIDIVEQNHMLADALKEKLSFANHDVSVVYQEDEQLLPFRTERFHVVYAKLTPQALPDLDAILKEANRILLPSGRLVMWLPPTVHAVDHPHSARLLRHLLKQRGFSKVVVVPTPKYFTKSPPQVWYRKALFVFMVLFDQLFIAPFSKKVPFIVIADK